MTEAVKMLLAIGFCTAGVGIFGWGLRDVLLNADGIRQSAINSAIVHIGKPGPDKCATDIHLTAWAQMNRLGIYNWVSACERAAQ